MSAVASNGPVRAMNVLPTVVCYAPVPTGTPTAADRVVEKAPTAPHPFAEMLRQSRDESAAPAAPAPTAPAAPSAEEDTSASAETSEPMNAPGPAPAVKTKARPTTPAAGTVASRDRPAEATDERIAADKNKDTTANDANGAGSAAAGTTRSDAWIAQALAGADAAADARDRTAAALRQGGTRGVAESGDDAAAETTTGARSGSAATRAAIRLEADAATLAGRAERGDDERTAAGTPTFLAALSEAAHATEGAPAHTGGQRIDALASTAATGAAGSAGEPLAAAAAPSEVALPTPIDSPDFGAAFGVQVSLLAQDGVQQAELHLNPSETGPVSIHIALDGSNARIDFGADLAATREAIERSLPELAAALRDAGLTLTGGGVSQHAGERPGGSGEPSTASRSIERTGAAGSAQEPVRTSRRVAAGGVDLYA